MPRLRPRIANEPTLIAIMMPAMMKAVFPNLMKSKFVCFKKSRVIFVENFTSLFFISQPSMMRRVMKIEVNNEVQIPIINVVAKPCTGPVPNSKRMKPVRNVVI